MKHKIKIIKKIQPKKMADIFETYEQTEDGTCEVCHAPLEQSKSRTSKEIIDACWGKFIPEKPTAPFLTEEALTPKEVPTKFFTPIKPYDCFNKFEPGYGNNIIDEAMSLLIKLAPPKEKSMEALDYQSAKLDGKIEAYDEIINQLQELKDELDFNKNG